MEITIKDTTIKLKKTFRSIIAYEAATGQSFNPKTLTDSIMYFYCVIIASNQDVEIGYEEFMDWLDENPTELNEFTQWLIEQNTNERDLSAKKKNSKAKAVKK